MPCRFSDFLRNFNADFLSRRFVTSLGNEAFAHFTLVINSPPEIVPLAVDLYEDFIQVPAAVPEMPHRLDAIATYLCGKHSPEPVPPEAHRFMSNVDAPFVQQVLDIGQGQRLSHVHHHCQADDLGRGFKITKDASAVRHGYDLIAMPSVGKFIFL